MNTQAIGLLNKLTLSIASLSLALAATLTAAAPLSSIDPGRVRVPDEEGLRNDTNQMPGSLQLPASEIVAEPPPLIVTPKAPSLPASDTPFAVRKVRLEGVKSYPENTFTPLLQSLEGRQVTLAEVQAVTERITQRYRHDGYLLVRSYVPAQELNDGELVLRVVEGKVNKVTVSGASNRTLEGYAENIREEAPLRGSTLERNLLLMNDLSGNETRGVLSASEGTEGSDLNLENKQRRWEGFFGFDNRDSRYYGPWQVYGGVGLNDPFGIGDHLALRLGRSVEGDKLAFYEGQYEMPVGRDGTVLSLLAQHNDGNADTLDFLNANSSGDTLAARITHPWIRSRNETFKTSLAFTWFNGESEYLDDPDLPPSSEDHIRALRLGASWDFSDKHGGRNLLKGELSQGLDVLGASSEKRLNTSRLEGQTDFTKLQVDAQRIQDLDWLSENLKLYLAVTGQTSFGDPLLSPEQFGVGGSEFGRGYDPSEIAGDSGLAGKVELQYNTVHSIKDHAVPTQYYGYWDVGRVWNEQPRALASESLASAGFGAHLQVAKDMFVSPEVAFPLTRTVQAEELDDKNGKEPRFYLNFLKLF
ncbi:MULTISPECIES: ShlB/FhaC/HecB family hemolysin secretion/activation protein [unclassified Pseudomonas]|uniref:ShlB/FhaC/HecB family hemolysin secretion/activation protein n=1 Tax=unclassified Pseudomonas TaxID=196821 RepID=UPI0024491D47|nr:MULTISPECIES: ShlB/FhaC/HecB family hemolysin secretion/activation protein [unclassified Pseudomonas]MDG9924440.1 ShlB/FhaC/HecB family hemolysin secretion/activation protein [Pseudomonas sp. GD04045]MDH0035220.1 ShlB/FhaC/HecB family hemolysin secretion/activation protein [Pseudomonas sp. GD04019]